MATARVTRAPGESESTLQNVRAGERYMKELLGGSDPRRHFCSYIDEKECTTMDEKSVTDYMSDVYDVICGTMQIDKTRDICPNQVIAIDAFFRDVLKKHFNKCNCTDKLVTDIKPRSNLLLKISFVQMLERVRNGTAYEEGRNLVLKHDDFTGIVLAGYDMAKSKGIRVVAQLNLYRALGLRNTNVQDPVWGGVQERQADHASGNPTYIENKRSPYYWTITTFLKAHGSQTYIKEVGDHKDLTKCAKFHIALHYLNLLFLEKSIELPSVHTWLDEVTKKEKTETGVRDVCIGGKGQHMPLIGKQTRPYEFGTFESDDLRTLLDHAHAKSFIPEGRYKELENMVVKDVRNTIHSLLSNDVNVPESLTRLVVGRDAKSGKSGDQHTKAYAVTNLAANNVQSGYMANTEVQAAHHDMLGACLPGDPRADQTESKVKEVAVMRKMFYDNYLPQLGSELNKYEIARGEADALRREGEADKSNAKAPDLPKKKRDELKERGALRVKVADGVSKMLDTVDGMVTRIIVGSMARPRDSEGHIAIGADGGEAPCMHDLIPILRNILAPLRLKPEFETLYLQLRVGLHTREESEMANSYWCNKVSQHEYRRQMANEANLRLKEAADEHRTSVVVNAIKSAVNNAAESLTYDSADVVSAATLGLFPEGSEENKAELQVRKKAESIGDVFDYVKSNLPSPTQQIKDGLDRIYAMYTTSGAPNPTPQGNKLKDLLDELTVAVKLAVLWRKQPVEQTAYHSLLAAMNAHAFVIVEENLTLAEAEALTLLAQKEGGVHAVKRQLMLRKLPPTDRALYRPLESGGGSSSSWWADRAQSHAVTAQRPQLLLGRSETPPISRSSKPQHNPAAISAESTRLRRLEEDLQKEEGRLEEWQQQLAKEAGRLKEWQQQLAQQAHQRQSPSGETTEADDSSRSQSPSPFDDSGGSTQDYNQCRDIVVSVGGGSSSGGISPVPQLDSVAPVAAEVAEAVNITLVEKALTLTHSNGSDAVRKMVEKFCGVADVVKKPGWASRGKLGCGGNGCSLCAAAAAAAAAAAKGSRRCEHYLRADSIDKKVQKARKIMRLVASSTISGDQGKFPDVGRITEGIAKVQEHYNVKGDWNFVDREYEALGLSEEDPKILLAFWDSAEVKAAACSGPSPSSSAAPIPPPSSASPSCQNATNLFAAAVGNSSGVTVTNHDYAWLAIDPGSEKLGFARCYAAEHSGPRLEIGWVNLSHVKNTDTKFVRGPMNDQKKELGATRLGALRRALRQVFAGSPRYVFMEGYDDRGDKRRGDMQSSSRKRSADGDLRGPMSGTKGQGHNVNHEVRGVIKEFASSVPHPPEVVHSWLDVSWKAASHQALKIPGGVTADKSVVRGRVENILGLALAPDFIHSQAGRRITLPDDVSDAVAIGLFGCKMYRLQDTYKGATISAPKEIRADFVTIE